ncbi:MAG TPA: hypothetical protein PL112_01850, partial [Candidatus Obscuribacter sp.]|nr:hypothetical protein [Candidatus Obscuribacter sp.]HND65503.1 hypothetical protein [Candidatus Obscuribacter sp.]
MPEIAVHKEVSSPAAAERELNSIDVNSLFKGVEKGAVASGAVSDTVHGEKVLPSLQITGLADDQPKSSVAAAVVTREAGSATAEPAGSGSSSRGSVGDFAGGKQIFAGTEGASESVPYYSDNESFNWNNFRRKDGVDPKEIPVLPDGPGFWERIKPKPEPA